MFKEIKTQPTLGEHILYQNLPKDFLYEIDQLINWAPFESLLSKLHPSKVGRKAYNPLQMFKILIIQEFYNLSDPRVELDLYGNLFYRRFVKLYAGDPIPDHSTISRFREDLENMNLYLKCFDELKSQLKDLGFEIEKGKIVDARLVKAARKPKKGDEDADFTVKNNKVHYGYKDHIAIDEENEFILEFICSAASVHDSQVLDILLDGKEEALYADKAYDSKKLREQCKRNGTFYGVLTRGRRNRPLSEEEKERNKKLSKIRSKVERVFGIFSLHLRRARARYVGLLRNEIHLFLTCFTYNLLRLVGHKKRKRCFV